MLFSALTLAVAIAPTQAYLCTMSPTRGARNDYLNALTDYIAQKQDNINTQAGIFNTKAKQWKANFCTTASSATKYSLELPLLTAMNNSKYQLWLINTEIKSRLDDILGNTVRVNILNHVNAWRLTAAGKDVEDAAPRTHGFWRYSIVDPDCDDADNTPNAYMKVVRAVRRQQKLQNLLAVKNEIFFELNNLTQCLIGNCIQA